MAFVGSYSDYEMSTREVDLPEIPEAEAAAWAKCAFDEEEAKQWYAMGFTPHTATQWAIRGFYPFAAPLWAKFATAQEAARWLKADFGLYEADMWSNFFDSRFFDKHSTLILDRNGRRSLTKMLKIARALGDNVLYESELDFKKQEEATEFLRPVFPTCWEHLDS